MGLVFIYLSFKQKLVELKKKNKHLINVNRCPMHVTSNCFLKRVKVWTAEADNAFDQIVIDLFGFSGICKTCSRLLQCRKLCWFTSSTNSKTRFSKLDKPSEYFFTSVLNRKFLGVRLLGGGGGGLMKITKVWKSLCRTKNYQLLHPAWYTQLKKEIQWS